MGLSQRSVNGLSRLEIERCQATWEALCAAAKHSIPLDVSEADITGSLTRFVEERNEVVLGANVEPGQGYDANTRLSRMACLAHELAHALRYQRGYRRPHALPDMLRDEAEASLEASFNEALSPSEVMDLVEDARDRLIKWLDLIRRG